MTVADGSYDTKIPSNINDADIDINTQEMPQERTGVTDASFTRINAATCQIMRKMMSLSTLSGEAGSEDQNRLLDELYQEFDQSFLQDVGGSMGALYKIGVTIARLVVAKMTLIIFLPSMSSSSDEISTKERTKLLISAIEVAEYNHELNASQENRQWRWIYQTYTHWHAIVYLLIEIPRRSWSPIVERAWLALHSQWLIPSQSAMDKNLRIWVPLQKLMHKARKHRDVEIKRLRANPREAARLESEDERVPLPSSSGIFPVGDSAAMSRDHWRQLVAIPKPPEGGPRVPGAFDSESTEPSAVQSYTRQPLQSHVSIHESIDPRSNLIPNPLYSSTGGHDINQSLIPGSRDSERIVGTDMTPATELTNQTHGEIIAPEGQWPWIDSDPSFDVFPDLDAESGDIDMDFDGEVNWYELVNSAAGLERNIQTK